MGDALHGVPGRFSVVRCTRCSLVYLCPRPVGATLARFYPPEYGPWSAADAPSPTVSRSYALLDAAARLLYRVRYGDPALTLPPFGGGRLLDVGCGDGSYLRAMQQLGWDVHGIEVAEWAVEIARRRLGRVRVTHGTVADLAASTPAFDLIVLSHVLEHVPDPRALLDEARRRLTEHGRLRVIVPDLAGLEARLFGRYWLGLDVPRHLVTFSRRTLTILLRQTGFTVEACRPQYLPDLPYLSVRYLLDAKLGPGRPRLRRAVTKLTLGAGMISYAFGNRGAIDVLARKSV